VWADRTCPASPLPTHLESSPNFGDVAWPSPKDRAGGCQTDEAITGILGGRWSFYIQLGVYDVVNVQVATSPEGRFYLKTEADQDTPDELLFLPQCR